MDLLDAKVVPFTIALRDLELGHDPLIFISLILGHTHLRFHLLAGQLSFSQFSFSSMLCLLYLPFFLLDDFKLFESLSLNNLAQKLLIGLCRLVYLICIVTDSSLV